MRSRLKAHNYTPPPRLIRPKIYKSRDYIRKVPLYALPTSSWNCHPCVAITLKKKKKNRGKFKRGTTKQKEKMRRDREYIHNNILCPISIGLRSLNKKRTFSKINKRSAVARCLSFFSIMMIILFFFKKKMILNFLLLLPTFPVVFSVYPVHVGIPHTWLPAYNGD